MKRHFMNEKEKQEMMNHVRKQSEGGLSKAAYCKLHGLNPSNFYRYQVKASKGKKAAPQSGFVRVTSETVYEVVVGNVTVKVPSNQIANFLKEVNTND